MDATAERRPVVVGVDGSEQGHEALRWAAREADLRGATLLVVHAWLWPLHHVPLGPPPSGPPGSGLEVQAKQVLADARAGALACVPGLTVETQLVTGDAAATLLRFAEIAQLVVVGDRGLGGFSGLLLGSVGVQVSAHSACPVAVVRGDPPPESAGEAPVVAGVDGSERADAALGVAFEEAEMRGAPLVALHAWVSPVAVGVDVAWNFGSEEAERSAATLLDDALTGWVAKFPSVPVERRLVDGGAAGALVRASAGARLLVVGCRGRGALSGLLMGSTSHAAIHHAECPVLVVHHV